MRDAFKLAVVGSLFLAAAIPALAGEGDVSIDFDQSPALHFPIGEGDEWVTVVPAFEDYANMMFDVCDALKLTTDECTIFPMNADLGGIAIATILDGNNVIVYDRELSPKVGYSGAMAIIAHEIGHHYCGHLGTAADPQKELAADRFAGAALRNAGMTLADALSMAEIFNDRPSRSHPAKAERIQAIREGWENPEAAKMCGS